MNAPNPQSNQMVLISQTLAAPQMQERFKTLLPPSIPLDRFTEVTMMAIRQTPEVLQADRDTLYDACLNLARRGLMPDKKEAALVIFSTNEGTRQQPRWVKKVQAMPMVEGIIKELAKAGVKAYAVSVYANDRIRLWNDDDGQHVEHEPVMFGDRGARIGAYASGKMPDGRNYVEAMNMAELERVALRSKQARKDNNGNAVARGGTWASDPERMDQKTTLHRLRKRMPILNAEEALQNLRDMEDESDIDFDQAREGEETRPPEGGAPNSEPESPPPQNNQNPDEPVTSPARRARRPRALQSVIEQSKPTPPEPAKAQPSFGPPEEYESQEGDII